MSKLFDLLEDRLLRAGGSPRRVRRYIAELRDHLADLTEEEQRDGKSTINAETSAIARLGDPDELARLMMERPGFRSWTGMAPWATLFIGPAALLTCAYGMLILLVGGAAELAGNDRIVHTMSPQWLRAISTLITVLDRFALPVLIGWGLTTIAVRQRSTALWPLLGLATVSFFGAALYLNIQWPTASGMGGELTAGFQPIATLSDLARYTQVWLLNVLTLTGLYGVRRLYDRRRVKLAS